MTNKPQTEKPRKTAKQLDCDEGKESFEQKLKRLAEQMNDDDETLKESIEKAEEAHEIAEKLGKK